MQILILRSPDGLRDIGTVTIENKMVKQASEELRYMKGWREQSVLEYAKTNYWKVCGNASNLKPAC